MINLSELRIIEDIFFRSRLVYHKPTLYPLIDTHFNEANEYSEATDVKLKNIVKTKKGLAHNLLLESDLSVLRKGIDTVPKQFDEQLWRDMLPKIRQEVKKILGLDFKPRSIFFEDSFPEGLESFELKGASSITIFEGNAGAGVYFLNKRVSSSFTPILLIHEQMHSCLSQNKSKDQMYIEWFEEAICQWFSLRIYYNLTKNMETALAYKERCYIYSKVKDEHNFTRRYYEYMKILSRLLLHGGYPLIGKIMVSYLSNDRETVNQFLNLEKMDMKVLPEKDIDQFRLNLHRETAEELV
ncbi:MAG: hypothetical protein HGA85_00360, partial [Nanoarchaeota archaeon]|nr:hypothetical protein [Nanoarchaeota archaeon]